MKLKFLNYAGAVTSLSVPTKNGPKDAVVSLGEKENYLKDTASFGALVGRFANRIKDGKFELDGEIHQVDTNDRGNHLHGGYSSLRFNFLDVEIVAPDHAQLTYLFPDGDAGFEGNVKLTVDYILTESNEWKIIYHAETDKPTPVNFTSHCYFNLGTDLQDHLLTVPADEFIPIDEVSIPLSESPVPVENSDFDLREPRQLGDCFQSKHPQIQMSRGFDQTFVRSSEKSEKPESMAVLEAEGIKLEILTTEPGVQVFTANFEEPITYPDGTTLKPYCGICLETQHFPDSPNRPDFPSTILRPGEIFRSETIHRFTSD